MNSNLKKNFLVIGGGYTGLELHRQLCSLNQDTDLISRTRVPLSSGQQYALDVSTPYALNKHYDVIFYLISPDSSTSQAYQKAYISGVQHSLKALAIISKNSRFFLCSSTAVYQEDSGALVHEDSPLNNKGFRSQILLQGEQLVRGSGLDSVVLRLSGIYGPGRERLYQAAKKSELKFKSSPCISNRIHQQDCVRSMIHLAFQKSPAPIYNISDCKPTDYNNLIRWLAKQTRHKLPIPSESKSLNSRLSNKKICNKRLLASGYQFKFPDYKSGFKELILRDSSQYLREQSKSESSLK